MPLYTSLSYCILFTNIIIIIVKGVDIIEITITSKIQIYPTNEQIDILNNTMFQIRKALNYISKYILIIIVLIRKRLMKILIII
ncbi:hypothetical protein C1146_15095 [Clostridium botulinum]|nr:hypothetical protein C1146_15095 [Clostridium botulinum]RUT63305.1 hypothetical protein C1149_16120 [Clostridium botulinum]